MFQFYPIGCLGSHFPDGEVVLRGNAEGIGDAIEEGEHGDDVDGLGDLVFGPAGGAKFFDIFGSGTVGGFGDELGVVQQGALRPGQARFIELAFENGCDSFIGGSLNPQEVSVAVQSIGAAIEEGDVAGDHFLGAPVEVPLGKMDGVGEINNLTEEVGARAEAFDDAGNLLAAGAGAPVVIGRGRVAGGGVVFGNLDLRFRF
jgi:hypothetical protein